MTRYILGGNDFTDADAGAPVLVGGNPMTLGGGGVLSTKVTVTSAEFLASADTPVVVIPGVAGYWTRLIWASITAVFGTLGYTNGQPFLATDTGLALSDEAPIGSASETVVVNMLPDTGSALPMQELDGGDVVLKASGTPENGDGDLIVSIIYTREEVPA